MLEFLYFLASCSCALVLQILLWVFPDLQCMSQAKDIMFHLYMTAVANLQRQMPKDIKILKHLIMIEDSEERLSALNDAFTPGPELLGDNVDTLYT